MILLERAPTCGLLLLKKKKVPTSIVQAERERRRTTFTKKWGLTSFSFFERTFPRARLPNCM